MEQYRKLDGEAWPEPILCHKAIYDAENKVSSSHVVYANARFLALLDSSLEEVVGRDVDEVVAEAAGVEKFDVVQGVIGPNPDVVAQFFHTVQKWYAVVSFEAHPLQYVTFFREITEVKRVERELSEYAAVLRSALESTADGLLLINNDGQIVQWNEKFLGMFRLCEAPLDSRFLVTILSQLKEPSRYAKRLAFLGSDKEAPHQELLEFSDGRVFDWYSKPHTLNSKVQGRVHSFRDVTEHKKAEQALMQSEAKLSALFEAMTEMVVLHQLEFHEGTYVDYRIIDCNQAFCTVTGIPRDKAIGSLASEVYGVKPAPYLKEFATVATTGTPTHLETYFAPMDRYFRISVVSPRKNEFATITLDVTKLRKMQQTISNKNQELEQLVYIASHDLRSPLVNVDGYSREAQLLLEELGEYLKKEVVKTESLDTIESFFEEIREALSYVTGSAQHMDGLLKGLLRLSRFGRKVMEIRPLDMNALLAKVLDSFHYRLREEKVTVQVDNLPPCRGDYHQVWEVFLNLVDNALKYGIPEKEGEIHISGKIEGNTSIYQVRDTGIGIAPQYFQKIFELFHQLDPKKKQGEGLGLAIVQQAVNRLEGKIWVESELGKGSTFFVALPKG